MHPSWARHHASFDTKFSGLNFDISNGNLIVSNGNKGIVTQDLCAKVIISECFLIAAMEQTNKIWRTYINTKALSMDIRTSVVEKIVKNGSDIISGYFCGNFSDVLKAVNISRSMVKKVNYRACDIFVESHVCRTQLGSIVRHLRRGKWLPCISPFTCE